ncbi:MAG: hypothetical protein ACLRWP_15505 [Bilophila wadsworthia]
MPRPNTLKPPPAQRRHHRLFRPAHHHDGPHQGCREGRGREPLAGKVKIMIGGAPVNDAFRESIGADYYTPDASSAAEKALEICAAARA